VWDTFWIIAKARSHLKAEGWGIVGPNAAWGKGHREGGSVDIVTEVPSGDVVGGGSALWA